MYVRTTIANQAQIGVTHVISWPELQERMLAFLGTPEERRQLAVEAIKGCSQRQRQSPTQVLHYLQPLWAKVEEHSLTRQKDNFISALQRPI